MVYLLEEILFFFHMDISHSSTLINTELTSVKCTYQAAARPGYSALYHSEAKMAIMEKRYDNTILTA